MKTELENELADYHMTVKTWDASKNEDELAQCEDNITISGCYADLKVLVKKKLNFTGALLELQWLFELMDE